MTIHAFIDESRRGNQYLMAVAVVAPTELHLCRKQMRQLLLPGERELHLYKQGIARRRRLADQICAVPVEVTIYQRQCGSAEEPARQACIAQLTQDLLERGAHRMVFDSRNTTNGDRRDTLDRETIRHTLKGHPQLVPLTYEHVDSKLEPLLWIADIVGWCWGAGGEWRKRVDRVVRDTVSLT